MDSSMDLPVEQREEVLTIDLIAREQLAEAARWARFLAIMGFIGCGIILVAGIFMTIFYLFMSHITNRYNYSGRSINSNGRLSSIGMIYAIGSLLYFFRCLYLFRFANQMRSGLQEQSQDEVNESLRNLKNLFRYNGILTIVLIALYIIILFAAMIIALNR